MTGRAVRAPSRSPQSAAQWATTFSGGLVKVAGDAYLVDELAGGQQSRWRAHHRAVADWQLVDALELRLVVRVPCAHDSSSGW